MWEELYSIKECAFCNTPGIVKGVTSYGIELEFCEDHRELASKVFPGVMWEDVDLVPKVSLMIEGL